MESLLLAGPIVRRVDIRFVSVWVATSEACSVTLDIYLGLLDSAAGSELVTEDPLHRSLATPTRRFGQHLHVCVVMLALPEAEILQFGQVYSYNIKLLIGTQTHDLKSLGLLAEGSLNDKPHVPLGYAANRLPGFKIPPVELAKLNLYHASCRKPHGQDPDALAFLDSEIEAGIADPQQRPHQAFLTGDQIYADDIPIALMPYISQLGRELIGADEQYQLDDGSDIVINEKTLPAGMRKWITLDQAGFSSSAADSHLLSFGEFCAAYLFSFSNVSWPDMVTPHPQDASIPQALADVPTAPDINLNHLKPEVVNSEDEVVDTGQRHLIFQSADPPDIDGRLFRFFNDLNNTQRVTLEAPGFEKDKDELIEQLLKGRDTDPQYDFLVNEAVGVANALHPDEDRDTTIKHFFWIANSRRNAWAQVRPADPSDQFIRHTIANAYHALPLVRRALANVATYMIFDDHDVTDDWYINQAWRARVHSKPLGRAVLRNAMASYALFQGWGNDPIAFTGSGINSGVLSPISGLFNSVAELAVEQTEPAEPATAALTELDRILGLDGSIAVARWDYSVPSTDYLCVVLDTRTRRDFPAVFGAPSLISADSLDEQLPPGPLLDGRQVLIVISAAPILDLAVLEEIVKPIAIRVTEISEARAGTKEKIEPEFTGDTGFDLESWSANPPGFETLINRLASYEKVLILSGDVHFGACAALSYWRRTAALGEPLTIPAGDSSPGRISWRQNLKESRLVQFTSSAAKNQVPEADKIFLYAKSSLAQRLQRLDVPLERIGWADPSDEPVQISETHPTRPELRARLGLTPVILPTFNWPPGTSFLPFDWSWRIALLQDQREDVLRPPSVHPLVIEFPELDTPASEADAQNFVPDNAFELYQLVARRHADSLDKALFGRQMVFATNIGKVRFIESGGILSVQQDLLALHPNDPLRSALAYTQHTVSLEPTGLEPPVPGVSLDGKETGVIDA